MSGSNVFNRPSTGADAVSYGTTPSGDAVALSMADNRALEVVVRDHASAFGELTTTDIVPRVQIDAIFGLLPETDHEVFSATGGSVAATNSTFVCQTGTSVGGYGVLRSRRLVRYRAGQGILARFGAMFDSANATALSLQLAGMFTATDGLWFGYNGADFGVTRRIAGALEIQTLTISAAATGAENIDIELNGVTYSTSVTAGTTNQNCAEIVANGTFTGWTVQNVDSTVIFRQTSAAVQAGAFSFTNTTGGGTCAGTLAQNLAGAANDDTTGFVASSAWNIDKLDGTGPSGETIDPGKFNNFQIVLPWHGVGSITMMWYSPDKRVFVPVHAFNYANANTVPSQQQPIYRLGYTAASLGSTTNITVTGTSMLGGILGPYESFRTPLSKSGEQAATTTEQHILSIRPSIEYHDRVNQREFVLYRLHALVDQTQNRAATIRVYRNATLTGDVEWEYVNDGPSSAHYAQGASVTGFSGGIEVLDAGVTTQSPLNIDIEALDLRLVPGDTVTITVEMVSSTADMRAALTWQED